MDTVDQLGIERFDTRGLPEGYDPHKLYEYRFQKALNTASPIEALLYKYIPYELLKSFAIAIDPTSPFKVAPGVITVANRLKYMQTASVLLQRRQLVTVQKEFLHPVPNYYVSGCNSPYLIDYGHYYGTFPSDLLQQEALPNTLEDTTSRTRLVGSKQGTLKMFKGYINSPARYVSWNDTLNYYFTGITPPPNDPCIAHGGRYSDDGRGKDIYTLVQSPQGGRLSSSSHSLLKTKEFDYLSSLLQKQAIPMLKGISPGARDYTLFRNLVELKDIPGSISSLRKTLGDFRQLYTSLAFEPSLRKKIFDLKSLGKDVPNEYLSFHFGWKQTYKDVQDLLALPEKLGKKFNFLLSRSGKPTTFRSKRTFVSGESDVSGFDYDLTNFDRNVIISSRIKRETEVRLVVNQTFDFPPLDGPIFRNRVFLDRIGAIPRVTDIYNLIPWTWLVDWFTGVGNYIELIDNINNDKNLVNWGLISGVTTGVLETTLKSDTLSTARQVNETSNVLTEDLRAHVHVSTFNYKCQIRSDVATILDVKTISDPSTLTDYQKSILGALLAQRTGSSRSDTFRVRS